MTVVVGAGWELTSPGRATDSYCSQLAGLGEMEEHLGNLDLTGMRADQARLRQLRTDAPEELAPALRVLDEMVGALTDAIADSPPGEQDADRRRRAERVWRDRRDDVSRVAEAARAVEDHAATVCGTPLRKTS